MARYPAANWRGPVPNVGGPMGAVRLGVVHIMEGTMVGTDAWFHDPTAQVSAHFGIAKDGLVVQWVDTSQVAWAEAAFNDEAISVEHEGMSGELLTDAQIASLRDLVFWVWEIHNVPMIPALLGANGWGAGWVGHCQLGVAGGDHPECPGAPIMAQIPEVMAVTRNSYFPELKKFPGGREMFANDPVTGGVWATDPNGDCFALYGAPFVAGLNQHPGWSAGEQESAGANPCVGLSYWRGSGNDGIVYFTKPASGSGGITGTPYSAYRFRRDGTPD